MSELTMTRRTCLAMAASALLMPRRVFSAERLSMGGAELVMLSDGFLTLPADLVFAPAPAEDLAALAPTLGLDLAAPLTPPCNVTLLRTGERIVLFDCGAGPSFQASAGRLVEALSAEGIAPEDVTDVIFTHGHPDHLWGVLDDFDEPLFLNAAHRMGRVERDYWADPATVDAIGAARASFAAGASRRLEVLGDMLEGFEDGAEVAPGVTALLTPGHTPGHMAFVVASGDAAAMILGDAVANDHVALARPGWPSGSDQDQELGVETRIRLLDRVSADEMPVAGFHMGGGGLGRIEPAGEGYRFVADL